MSTCISDFVEQTSLQWKEVDMLTSEAIAKQLSGDEDLYNALCRSVTVLMVAHFEGFMKDLVKAIISDLNSNCKFVNMPEAVKRTYCKKYFGNNEEINKSGNKISKLKEKFETLDCKITHEPFFFPQNKNPNNKTIKSVFLNFGIKEIFNFLYESELENAAFTESSSTLAETLEKFKDVIETGTKDFPYKCDIGEYKLTHTEFRSKTLWEEFVDDINNKRHAVVHGNDFLNAEDASNLQSSKEKIMLLELALVGIMCDYITKDVENKISDIIE